MNVASWLLAAAVIAQSSSPSASGDSAFARGDFTEAFRQYSAAVAASPGDFDALLGLGTIDLYRGDLVAAQDYLAKALQINPSDPIAQRRMRALRELQGKAGD